MAIKHMFQAETTDEILVADQIVALFSAILLLIILIWVVIGFRKEGTLLKPLSISCMVSVICFMLFALIGSIGWTNVIFNISPLSCKIIYPMGLINYNIAKISMYWLFTLRIEVIFQHSALAMNSKLLWIYRISAAIIPSVLWSIWIWCSFVDLKPHKLNKYSHCFPITFRDVDTASHIAGALAWSDLCLSAIAVYIFIWKLYQVTQLHENSINKQSLSSYSKFRQSLLKPTKVSQKWIAIIRKSTVLCIIAILSTWTYVLGTAYILRQCGFFISFDGVINSLCLACLFKFGTKFYNMSCKHLDVCCIDICCCQWCLKKTIKMYDSTEFSGSYKVTESNVLMELDEKVSN